MNALPRCRKCGSAPRYHERDIVPDSPSYAITCAEMCGSDTHWQLSIAAAEKIWRRGPVPGERGGQGDPADDAALQVH